MTAPKPKTTWTPEELDAFLEAVNAREDERLVERQAAYTQAEQNIIDLAHEYDQRAVELIEEFNRRTNEANAAADEALGAWATELRQQGYPADDDAMVENIHRVFSELTGVELTVDPITEAMEAIASGTTNISQANGETINNFFWSIGSAIGDCDRCDELCEGVCN